MSWRTWPGECMMKSSYAFLLSGLFLANVASAEEVPSFAKQVRPFFARYCVECHLANEPDGGLSLDTYKGLLAGGDNGAVIVPGKPSESRMVLMVEGKIAPKMPPKRAKRYPKAEEIAVLRAWIAAGAKDDTSSVGVVRPAIPSRRKLAAPVAAQAYSPDGTTLAASGCSEVVLVDPTSG